MSTVDEMRLERHRLENQIQKALCEFTQATGLDVNYVSIDRLYTVGKVEAEDYAVRVDVELGREHR